MSVTRTDPVRAARRRIEDVDADQALRDRHGAATSAAASRSARFGMVLVLIIAVAGLFAECDRALQPDRPTISPR